MLADGFATRITSSGQLGKLCGTSWMMLPQRVSHACSTTGEATCSRHLLSDLLDTGGGTEAVKLAASAMSSSDCFLPLFWNAELPMLRARMST